MLFRSLVGSRNSIAVGIVAVTIGVLTGVGLGLLASARRGWVEDLVMRMADFTFAFPAILSAILITAILGPGTFNSILAIGIFNIPVFARITRGDAIHQAAPVGGMFAEIGNEVAS